MPETNRKIIFACASIVLAVCLCGALLSILGAAALIITDSETFESFSDPDTEVWAEEYTQADYPGISEAIFDQMKKIEKAIISIRGLSPTGGIDRLLYTPEQLRGRVNDEFFGDYTEEDAASDALVLWTFGLIERDADLLQIYIDLYSEAVTGFYDDSTGEMVVVYNSKFGGMESLTYAHEYIHVLQDQNYDLNGALGYNEETCQQDTERCAALQALIEGDATHAEITWFENYATQTEIHQIEEAYDNYDYTAFDASPAFLQEDLMFPYMYGQLFVEFLFNLGGWKRVDSAYSNPPVSTEQILHPERYPEDEPVVVQLPDMSAVFDEDWVLLDEGVMGEWYTYLILAYGYDPQGRLEESDAAVAAEGWGGDAYAVYFNEHTEETVMVMSYVWDTGDDYEQYLKAFYQYATQRFGHVTLTSGGHSAWSDASGYTSLYFQGNTTAWIFATNQQLADQVGQAFEVP